MSRKPKADEATEPHPKKQLTNPHKADIIRAVTTPLGFFALVVMASEVILGSLAAWGGFKENQPFYIVLFMIGLLLLMILLVAGIAVWRPEALSPELGEARQKRDESTARLAMLKAEATNQASREIAELISINVSKLLSAPAPLKSYILGIREGELRRIEAPDLVKIPVDELSSRKLAKSGRENYSSDTNNGEEHSEASES